VAKKKKKKKKVKRKKARKKGGFKLETRHSIGLLPWPKHWGMQGREGARVIELTARPCTVTVDIFAGPPGLFSDDDKPPNVFSMEMSMQDAKALAERILESAADARTFALAWKTQ